MSGLFGSGSNPKGSPEKNSCKAPTIAHCTAKMATPGHNRRRRCTLGGEASASGAGPPAGIGSSETCAENCFEGIGCSADCD